MSTAYPDDLAIQVTDVHKRYGDVQALDGVCLTIQRGEFFGILGPNGAGKTTLMEIMEGLRKADSGTVRVLGASPWPRNLALLPRLGVQTQASSFFAELTAGEHLETVVALYGLERKAAHETLAKVGLTDKTRTKVSKLSGGQQQRLALAAAIAHDPEVLFLDEPTASLDPQARRGLFSLLQDVRDRGRTIVYTTHHMDEAEALCDRVAIVDSGKVIALDRPKELLRGMDSPTRLLVPNDRLSLEAARTIAGVEQVTNEGLSLVLATRVPAQVMPAVAELTGSQDIEMRHATLEDLYLELTGTEYRA